MKSRPPFAREGVRRQRRTRTAPRRSRRLEVGYRTLGRVRQLSIRTGVIHRFGKLLRQNLGELIDRNIEPRGQLLDGIAAQYLLQFGNNRRKAALTAVAEHFAQHDRQHGTLELAECALECG